MARGYAIIVDALGAVQDLEKLPMQLKIAARIAVNQAATKARTWSARAVLEQLALPASYVSPSGGRLAVTDKATNNKLEATVTARRRPTSLARFVKGPAKPGQKGARVEVKPGVARYLKNAVLLKLNAGSSTDSSGNLGLAVRTPNGVRPSSAYRPVRLRNGMWLLYGPSVAQALLSAKESGIWPELTDDILKYLEDEFNRQMRL